VLAAVAAPVFPATARPVMQEGPVAAAPIREVLMMATVVPVTPLLCLLVRGMQEGMGGGQLIMAAAVAVEPVLSEQWPVQQ
tara:strand:- start:1171 stop:1413 length:243 start_codon:yes stop_codon:yes gene_type:complete